MAKVARPEATLRFYVEGQEVDGEAFWRAIRDLGGRATITAPTRRSPCGGRRRRATG